MTTDLRERIAAELEGVVLTEDIAADVVRRGRVVRRHRRVAVGALLAVGVVGGGAAIGHDGARQAQVATDRTATTEVTGSALAHFREACRSQYEAPDLFATEPVATLILPAGAGEETAVLAFRDSQAFGWCRLRSISGDGADAVIDSTGFDPHFAGVGTFVTPETVCCSLTDAIAIGVVTGDVDRVELVMGGGRAVDASVDGGVFAAAVGDQSAANLDGSAVRAYDEAGDLLEERPLLPAKVD
jgi:hypothetical protein